MRKRGGGGGGIFHSGLYGEALPKRVVSFRSEVYEKHREFMTWSFGKGREKCHLGT